MRTEAKTTTRILIVDDEETIRELLMDGLGGEGYDCKSCSSARDALSLLQNEPFDLMLSDIDMPGTSGVQLLQDVKSAKLNTDVIMVTGVVDTETAINSIRMGASDYVTKPFNLDEVLLIVERTLEKRRLIQENRDYQRNLETRVQERTAELESKNQEVEELFTELKIAFNEVRQAYQDILEALMAALDTRDTETQGHSLRVAEYTITIARTMGMVEPELTHMRRGALLHDVGKIGIPDAILRKPAKLTEEEWVVMRQHPEIGYQMLQGIKFLEQSLPIVIAHQERYDGTGYPRQLAGEQIPLGARIFAVADTLDAMTSNRPYRAALPYERAYQEVLDYSGIQFDPKVVKAFCTIHKDEWTQIQQRVLNELAARGKADKN
ncbi:MAG: HD domain-containing phosphohydrolase [Acidobacteriota bacterium]